MAPGAGEQTPLMPRPELRGLSHQPSPQPAWLPTSVFGLMTAYSRRMAESITVSLRLTSLLTDLKAHLLLLPRSLQVGVWAELRPLLGVSQGCSPGSPGCGQHSAALGCRATGLGPLLWAGGVVTLVCRTSSKPVRVPAPLKRREAHRGMDPGSSDHPVKT